MLLVKECLTHENTLCCWLFIQFPIFKPPHTIRSSYSDIFIHSHDSTNCIVSYFLLHLS